MIIKYPRTKKKLNKKNPPVLIISIQATCLAMASVSGACAVLI